jgi:two-component system response regulator GlrR
VEEAERTTLKVRRARLKVISGPDKGLYKDIGLFRIVVGTDSGCDLVLTDQSVSRRHFDLAPCPHGFRLCDLESTNGTIVKGMRAEQITLTGREDIRIGQTRLRLLLLDDHEEHPLSPLGFFGPLLGESIAMRQVFALLEPAARSNTILLLEGESGTGKDLAAETVHRMSARKDQPFIVVDCGTIQSTLVESELFGHRKGAFTGAEQDRMGALESAHQGTIFLDEIGELDLSIQPKLLRLLENREIKRLGENHYRPVDVRLIAATNRDLEDEVRAGRFREDLYYRLSVLRVRMPALRDRLEDVAMLARRFVQQIAPEADPESVINESVMSMFMNHDWPGNVRELRNAVQRLLLFPERPGAALRMSEQPGAATRSVVDLVDLPYYEARRKWTEDFERDYLSALLADSGGVVARAAKRAGIARQTLYKLLDKYNFAKK